MIRRLLNTTVFRLSLVYALLFSLVAGAAMASIYWVASGQIREQTDVRLELQSDLLINFAKTYGSLQALRDAIRIRNEEHDERVEPHFYVYALNLNTKLPFTKKLEAEYMSEDGRRVFGMLRFSDVLEIIDLDIQVRRDAYARVVVTRLPGGAQLLVAADMSEQNTLLQKLYKSMWVAIALMFLLAVLGGWLMGYGVLRRIDSIRQTAGEIINGDLSQRMVVTRRNDEFDRLSLVLNSMLQRIENLMKATREVTDNLAHDLRNPLNRLRNRLDTSRFQPIDAEHFQQLRQDALQDVDDLIKTFNALLSIAQAESGVHRDDWTAIQLDQLISDLGELYEAVAEEEGIKFSYKAQAGLVLQANRHLIAQVITNLLDNAVKYTPKEGVIQLSAEQQAGHIVLTVSDTGPGIPAEERERVFKRFVRLDNARNTPGNGLGLSLVKAVADLHDAQVELADNQPGLKVILRFAG